MAFQHSFWNLTYMMIIFVISHSAIWTTSTTPDAPVPMCLEKPLNFGDTKRHREVINEAKEILNLESFKINNCPCATEHCRHGTSFTAYICSHWVVFPKEYFQRANPYVLKEQSYAFVLSSIYISLILQSSHLKMGTKASIQDSYM